MIGRRRAVPLDALSQRVEAMRVWWAAYVHDGLDLTPEHAYDNIFGVPVGTFDSVAVGYWAMLDGLSVGVHTIHFGGHFAGTPSLGYAPFDTDITYTITVAPAAVPEPASLVLTIMGGLGLIVLRRGRKRGEHGVRPESEPA